MGAVAFVGSQGGTWYLHNNALDKGIYQAITDEGATILGEALVSGKAYAFANTAPSDTQDVMMKEYTILGDPSLQYQTRVPQAMIVSTTPSVVPMGQDTEITVSVSDSGTADPVSDALVCLRRSEDVYAYGYTDDAGSIVLTVSPEAGTASIDLTVTAYNRIPVLDSISVSASDRPPSPKNLTLATQSDGAIVITWDPAAMDGNGVHIPIDGYEVYRFEATDVPRKNSDPVGSTRKAWYTDSSVSTGEGTWFYQVVAVGANGCRSKQSALVGISRRLLER
jgi:hypothetical protein